MPADMTGLFTRAVSEIITEDELRAKLKRGRPLRLKLGMDPSRPNLHVGHAVGLRKLRAFQEMGHTVVLIVGDWTAQIGDPSGRDESRLMLTADLVRANAQTYMDQFFLIMDKDKTEVRWQSEWYGSFSLSDVFNLSSRFTLADMLAHETFRRRWDEGRPVSIMELMYPLLQGYDSVVVQADVEFGGTDQKFNNLAGRQLQSSLGQPPQSVFLWPLLVGLDGRKMSKSFGNTIDLTDPPGEMYGKVMSTADAVLLEYFVATTDVPMAEIAEMRQSIAAGSVNPRDLKMRLGREIVAMFHGAAAAQAAQDEFVRIFQRRELPSDMRQAGFPDEPHLFRAIAKDRSISGTAAKQIVYQGGAAIDGIPAQDPMVIVHFGSVVQHGRHYVQVVASGTASFQSNSARVTPDQQDKG